MPKTNLPPSHQRVVEQVKLWLETIVVGLNLCPFAKRELMKDRIRFFVSAATTEEMLVCDLEAELGRLERDPSIETTLIIHPQVLSDFFEYQQFLIWADRVLKRMGLRGVFQIASFHPDYQFLNSVEHAPGNYTNAPPTPCFTCFAKTAWQMPSPITPIRTKSPSAISLTSKAWGPDSCAHYFPR